MLDILLQDCIKVLQNIDNEINWLSKQVSIRAYIKTKKQIFIDEINISETPFYVLLLNCLISYAENFRKKQYLKNPQWDRIYVTTLFTFYWKITVETIEFAKRLVKTPDQIFVGGVLASLLHKELEIATGIKPMKGLLDKPGVLDGDNDIIIDNLPLDYSILDEIDYEYPTRSAYFTFMTKGCTRKCAFCSVPILEPTYKPKIETIDKFQEIKEKYGEQQNLLLMDNNVLASPNFEEIIQEIKDMGFVKGATFIEPNQLEIAVKNLILGINDNAYKRRIFRLIHEIRVKIKGKNAEKYYNTLDDFSLLKWENVTKDNILNAYPLIADIYEKYRNKAPKLRYVDFNQGTDCRYITEERMKLISEIPIKPLRIAFDYIGLEKQYTSAVRLAAKYGIKQLSNYILYNFNDTPEELWKRLKINIDLCHELGVEIFSFPMKYIPLFGEEAKHREYTGKNWNKKFIRAIQSVLNVTKGIVAPAHAREKTSFFEEAFGQDLEEYRKILYMPETYIIYRHLFKYKLGYTDIWENEYNNLTSEEKEVAHKIIETNIFTETNINSYTNDEKIINFLRHYSIPRGGIVKDDIEYKKLKNKFDKLILQDQFIDLTLTYDFEKPIVSKNTYTKVKKLVSS